MYISRVQRVQETDISFSDADYDEWKLANPEERHSHERYIELMAEMILDEDICWTTSSADIVCIIFSPDRQD
jgi:hypothetical protein